LIWRASETRAREADRRSPHFTTTKPLSSMRHAIDQSPSATIRSIIAMLVAQAVFTANDTCVKLVAEGLPIGETMALRNGFATLYILVFAVLAGGLGMPRDVPVKAFGWRIVGEIGSTIAFLWALTRMPLADITALGQITPIAITAAGALFLREPVGWRRWLAALLGLLGVLLIVQPGTSAFTWAAVIALMANALGVLRDLATRVIGPSLSTLALVLSSVAAVLLAGIALLPFETWQIPSARELLLAMAAGLFLTLGYAFLIISLRTGDLAAVSPFRYSAILWALFAGYLLWGELPGPVPGLGIAIVVAAGLYTVHWERNSRQTSR